MISPRQIALIVAALSAVLCSSSAFGADPLPGSACTVANARIQSGGPETSGVVYDMTCQSSVWVPTMTYLASSFVGIGTTAPTTPLMVVGGGTDATGGIRVQNTMADATNKQGRIKTGHYTNAEEPVSLFIFNSTSSQSNLNIGGGSGSENSTTQIAFFTAADNTTVTGSERMRITSSGNVGIGTTNPTSMLEVQGQVRSVDSSGVTRIYGEGRAGAVRYGTTGVESGLCTNGSFTFGLSRGTAEWSSAAAACPSGTWVCTASERGTGACNSARPDGTTDGYQGDGTAVNFGATAHVGWTADWDATATTVGTSVDEAGTVASYPEPRSYPVWCCN